MNEQPLLPMTIPPVFQGLPQAGHRTHMQLKSYKNTQVHHVLYLPTDWQRGKKYPVIVEYTGNYAPEYASTGRVEDAHMGYGLTLGCGWIWVSMPYVSVDGKCNERNWWGDEEKTVRYCIDAVAQVCAEFGGDPNRVILCGFSRGAMAVNYIGLHNDEIAGLWKAFIANEHYDGDMQWPNTAWGWPLATYRAAARKRLLRIGNRPSLLIENDDAAKLDRVRDVLGNEMDNRFTLWNISIKDNIAIPNPWFPRSHTDWWLLFDCEPARRARAWLLEKMSSAV